MIEAAKQGVKRTKKVLSLNLLRGLRKRRMGTPAVEKMAKNLMEEKERQENVVIKLMDCCKFGRGEGKEGKNRGR